MSTDPAYSTARADRTPGHMTPAWTSQGEQEVEFILQTIINNQMCREKNSLPLKTLCWSQKLVGLWDEALRGELQQRSAQNKETQINHETSQRTQTFSFYWTGFKSDHWDRFTKTRTCELKSNQSAPGFHGEFQLRWGPGSSQNMVQHEQLTHHDRPRDENKQKKQTTFGRRHPVKHKPTEPSTTTTTTTSVFWQARKWTDGAESLRLFVRWRHQSIACRRWQTEGLCGPGRRLKTNIHEDKPQEEQRGTEVGSTNSWSNINTKYLYAEQCERVSKKSHWF